MVSLGKASDTATSVAVAAPPALVTTMQYSTRAPGTFFGSVNSFTGSQTTRLLLTTLRSAALTVNVWLAEWSP